MNSLAAKERAFYACARERTMHSRTARGVVCGSSPAVPRGPGEPFPAPRLLRQLRDRQRMREKDSLREVDADALELREHRLGLHGFGDGGDPERPADLADGLDHAAVDWIVRDMTDELAVDHEKMDRDRLQVHERAHAGAEITDRELADAPPNLGHEIACYRT